MGRRIRLDRHRPDGAERLAQAVRARRDELRIPRTGFDNLSSTTVYSIETQRKDSFDTGALDELERGLSWQPGSVDRILRGQDPVPVSAVEATEKAAEHHEQEHVSRQALYRMMMAMGQIYGSAMIMDVAGEVVADLQKSDGHAPATAPE